MQHVYRHFGFDLPIVLKVDSTGAIGIMQRMGVGSIRHLDCKCLWLQSLVSSRAVSVQKVDTALSGADILTKPMARKRLLECYELVHLVTGVPPKGGSPRAWPRYRCSSFCL